MEEYLAVSTSDVPSSSDEDTVKSIHNDSISLIASDAEFRSETEFLGLNQDNTDFSDEGSMPSESETLLHSAVLHQKETSAFKQWELDVFDVANEEALH